MIDDLDVEDLYENAPCGYLSVRPDMRIARLNSTLATWLGFEVDALVGTDFGELLTVGGRIHYETHFGPMLLMNGKLDGIALDLVTADRRRLPVFITANVKIDAAGRPVLIRITALDARDRRTYERELLQSRTRAELLAKTLQRSLLPPALLPPSGMTAAAHYRAASRDEVGGDFYDLFPLSDDCWGFFLGDVCGKGASAAAVTSLTRYTLRAAAVYDENPVAVLQNLDSVLRQEFRDANAQFCTAVFGILSRTDTGFEVSMASGGHPPPLVLRADGTAHYVTMTGGQLIGILRHARFVPATVTLEAGDTLMLYSDGLTEARVGRGRYDDDGALLEFATAHAPATPAAIVDDLRLLLRSFGDGLADDAAVMALGVSPAPDSVEGSEG
ncbi:Phosphoserine phosphatase RsbP [Rhodococcoides fascians]|uniref:Phosphoserine phosphatase RsbP n=1 Tax=Rhodococcoides fascians TaxID=1828 RepID=A0A143QI61_RHOFA|nr:SpoIIE family protein phosphatase [Rhodococcus fascians]AMY22496.1 Phosphoserine phosphatase RsbP [Rhodococcus fascians]KMJ51792.1 histidine kinase [Rhodococcus fascians]OZC39423.1 histidine kinase [Rhodococcus fascians]